MSGPAEALAALGEVVGVLEGLGIGYYVTGSMASTVYGLPRTTVDADLVAEFRPVHVRPFCEALAAAFYVSPEAVGTAVARSGSFNVIHLETMVKIDVFVLRGGAWDRSAFARRRLEDLGPGPGGRRYFLSSAEDVVLAKLRRFRGGGESSERQWGDVLGVLRVSGAGLDRDYLDRSARELGVEDLLRKALEEASPPPESRDPGGG